MALIVCACAEGSLIGIFGFSREVDKNYPNETYQGTILA